MTRSPEDIAKGNRRYDEQTAKDIIDRMTDRQKEFAGRAAARLQDIVPT